MAGRRRKRWRNRRWASDAGGPRTLHARMVDAGGPGTLHARMVPPQPRRLASRATLIPLSRHLGTQGGSLTGTRGQRYPRRFLGHARWRVPRKAPGRALGVTTPEKPRLYMGVTTPENPRLYIWV